MKHGVLKTLLPILLFLLHGMIVHSQQDSTRTQKSTPAFHVNATAGLVVGANGRDVQAQILPGIKYKSWFAGVGAGLDYYYWRGVPVFVSVQKLFQKPIPVFLYTNVGWHLPWVQDKYKTNYGHVSRFEKGLYYDAGVGWHASISRRHALQLSVGYSGKKVTDVQRSLFMPPGAEERLYLNKYVYDLRRISIKLGFQF